jgi:hypothetical protein|tara:strand:+ start:581 stop:919 length:339 start_codon:yes stop_codon:yes gene_type:complete
LLLISILRYQPEDLHVLGLSDAVAPRLGLNIVLGIPVAVEYDASVRGGEVNSNSPGPSAQQHDLRDDRGLGRPLELEPVNCKLRRAKRGAFFINIIFSVKQSEPGDPNELSG